MQDIVPKKSIREITKPHVPKDMVPQNTYQKTSEKIAHTKESFSNFSEYPHTKTMLYPKEKRYGWIIPTFFAVIVVTFGLFLHFQKSATVYITSKEEALTLKAIELAVPIDILEKVSISTSTSIALKTSTGTPMVTKAKGSVTIYNANSTDQILVSGTRLEASNGKIYRLDGRITVPKAVNASTPGSVKALITADKHGETYNITQSDFTFPGLLGSPRHKTVYARTTGPITGGAESSTQVVDEQDKAQKLETFLTQNKTSLEAKLRLQNKASTTIIQEPLTVTNFEKVSDTYGIITIVSSMKIIDSRILATLLTKSQKQNTTTEMEFTKKPNDLVFTYISEDKENARIKVSGLISVRPYVDTEVIKNTLAGTSMKEFREHMQNIPGIQEIRFTSKPFWVTTFPSPSRIFIEQK